MKDNRGFRTLAIIALIVAVVGISVAFAALSQTLTINATGKIKGSNWELYWSAASGVVTSGGTEASEGTLTSGVGTGVVNLTITDIILEKPGDKVTWTITARNNGDIDATLANITNILSKTVTINPAETSSISEDEVIVTLTKSPSGAIAAGDDLLANTTQAYLLTVEFDSNFTEVPSEDVAITINSSFPWVQK